MTDKKYVDPDYNPMMRPGLDDSEKISPDCSGLNFFLLTINFKAYYHCMQMKMSMPTLNLTLIG